MAQTILISPIIFLGGYVTSLSASFGYNTSPSTLDVTIVSVPGEAEFDDDSNPVGSFHQLDLSDFSNEANFRFGGILTSKNITSTNINGNTWSVQLSDPRIVMKGVELLLCPNPGYIHAGTNARVIDVWSLLNSNSDNYINLSSYEADGINIYDILASLRFSSVGSIARAGHITSPLSDELKVELWGETYVFNFTNHLSIDSNFKIRGDTINLLDLFQQIADGNAFDWYVEGFEDGSYNRVDITIIDRRELNQDLSLNDFINSLNVGAEAPVVNNVSEGKELRQDATGAIVFSDYKEFLAEIDKDDNIVVGEFQLPLPDSFFNDIDYARMFGDPSDKIQPYRIKLPIDYQTLEAINDDQIDTQGYLPEDDEFRAILAGFNNWLFYLKYVRVHPITNNSNFFANKGDYANSFQDADLTKAFWTAEEGAFARSKTVKITSVDELASLAYNSSEYQLMLILHNAYEIISKSASELYGRSYIFPERRDAKIVQSASTRTIEISSYTETNTKTRKGFRRGFEYDIIGDNRPTYGVSSIAESKGVSAAMDTFFDDGNGNGRTTAYAFFAGVTQEKVRGAEYSISESADNFTFTDGGLYVRASITNGIFKIAPVYDLVNTPCIINDLISSNLLSSIGISDTDCYLDLPQTRLERSQYFLCQRMMKGDGGSYSMMSIAKIPDKVYIPYKHIDDVWAVYRSSVFAGDFGTGPVDVSRDTSLSPANYSNFIGMNVAGFAKVQNMYSKITDMETGKITAAGLPVKNLGDPVGFNSNITSVNISISENSISTNYGLESFIQRYGKKEKQDSDIFSRLVKNFKKATVQANISLLEQNKDRIKVIEDVRTHVLTDQSKFNDKSGNPFGCLRITNYSRVQREKRRNKSEPQSIIDNSSSSNNNPGKQTNLPNPSFVNTLADIPLNVWEDSSGVGLEAFFTGWTMGDAMPSGGLKTYESTGVVSAGDLQLYEFIEKNGVLYSQLKEFVDGDSPVEANFNIDKIRGMALRSPLILSGWGFDTDGNKILANEEDKLDKDKWVTGPVDLRFDRTTGTWIAGVGAAAGVWKRWDNS